jgi:CBS-domain-containing membrane protein
LRLDLTIGTRHHSRQLILRDQHISSQLLRKTVAEMREAELQMRLSTYRQLLFRSIGSGLGIGLMGVLAQLADEPLVLVPFATSIVLVMAAPESPQAQPKNVLVGHLTSAAFGLCTIALLGNGLWVAALAVAMSTATMLLTNTLHPPAGISPVIIATQHPDYSFIWIPVGIGAVLLITYAITFHSMTEGARWPRKWF